MNKTLIVISGCSGGGKSTLLDALKNNGYLVIPEVGREIVKEQLQSNGTLTPWQNPIPFCEFIIARSIENYYHATSMITETEPIVFFDRCFLEGISYYQTLDLDDARKYDDLIQELRFYPTIFMAPPWREIYCQDDERKHSFEDAVAEYERLLKSYDEYGYRILELPKVSVTERCRYVLSVVNERRTPKSKPNP